MSYNAVNFVVIIPSTIFIVRVLSAAKRKPIVYIFAAPLDEWRLEQSGRTEN